MQTAGEHTPMYVIMNIQRYCRMLSCVSVMECGNCMYLAGVKVRLEEGHGYDKCTVYTCIVCVCGGGGEGGGFNLLGRY